MIASDSPITRQAIQTATPLALVLGVYLLFAGHNRPGGGFAAGLVVGAVVVLRTIAGLQRPRHADTLIAVGVVIAVAVAAMPVLWGDPFLDMKIVETTLPLLGKVKTGSALPFDIGVMAIVVGLIVALLDGLSISTTDDLGPGTGAA